MVTRHVLGQDSFKTMTRSSPQHIYLITLFPRFFCRQNVARIKSTILFVEACTIPIFEKVSVTFLVFEQFLTCESGRVLAICVKIVFGFGLVDGRFATDLCITWSNFDKLIPNWIIFLEYLLSFRLSHPDIMIRSIDASHRLNFNIKLANSLHTS